MLIKHCFLRSIFQFFVKYYVRALRYKGLRLWGKVGEGDGEDNGA